MVYVILINFFFLESHEPHASRCPSKQFTTKAAPAELWERHKLIWPICWLYPNQQPAGSWSISHGCRCRCRCWCRLVPWLPSYSFRGAAFALARAFPIRITFIFAFTSFTDHPKRQACGTKAGAALRWGMTLENRAWVTRKLIKAFLMMPTPMRWPNDCFSHLFRVLSRLVLVFYFPQVLLSKYFDSCKLLSSSTDLKAPERVDSSEREELPAIC